MEAKSDTSSSVKATCVIGLTGGIAAGKTSVSSKLRELGVPVIDADKIGHSIYAAGTECFEKVVEAFGKEIVGEDGEVNRRALGAIVFSSPEQMKKLTDLVWPAIQSKCREQVQQHLESGNPVVCVEAAILFEAGWQKDFDQIWVVDVPIEESKKRLMLRNNLSEEEALKRINSQMPREERIKQATVVIDNSGPIEQAQQTTEQEYRRVLASLALPSQ